MKKTTYKLPAACAKCGSTDRTKWQGDWAGFRCMDCGTWNRYEIEKVETAAAPKD